MTLTKENISSAKQEALKKAAMLQAKVNAQSPPVTKDDGKKWGIKPSGWNEFRQRSARPVIFFIENLVERHRSNLIFGDSGTGKSRIGWEICTSIAFGKDLWNRKTLKGKVLIIDGEMRDGEIQQRQDCWTNRCMDNGIDLDEEDFNNISFYTTDMGEELGFNPIDLYLPECRAALEPLLLQYDLVMFDNYMGLASLNTLSRDYTDAHAWEDIRKWTEGLERKGLTFIWIHHTNKIGSVRGTDTIKQHMTVALKILRPKIAAPLTCSFHCGITFDTKGRSIEEKFKTPLYLKLLSPGEVDPRQPTNRVRFNSWFIDPVNTQKPEFDH